MGKSNTTFSICLFRVDQKTFGNTKVHLIFYQLHLLNAQSSECSMWSFFFLFHTPLGQPDGSTKNSKYLYVCTTYQKFEEAMCMILFCQESYTHFIQSETSSHKVTGSIRKHPLSKLYPWGIFQRKTVQHYFNTRSGE